MKSQISCSLGPGDNITAGPAYDNAIWLRIEGRGRGTLLFSMNEYQAADIIKVLKPYAKSRNQDGR